MHKVVFQTSIDSLGVNLALPLRLIDSNQFLSSAGIFAETIIGDSIQPCREPRFTAETVDVPISANERLLGQVVSQGEIAAGELTQQTTDARLMTTNQLAKSVLVVINKNSSDKVRIG